MLRTAMRCQLNSEMKPNVLELVGSFHQGGSERQAVQLTKLLLDAQDINVHIATLDRSGVLLEEVEKLGFVDVPEFKLTSFYDTNFFFQLRNCVRSIKKNKISIVHTHDFYTNVFGIIAARIAGVDAAIASKRETGGMRSPLQDKIEKWIFDRSSAIVVNSDAVRKYLNDRGIAKRKLELIYNGLDISRFETTTTSRKEICGLFGLPEVEDAKLITHIANLRHGVKNQPMLLRAAVQIVKSHPTAHFVFAGEGELKPEMGKLADDLGVSKNVHFIGRCDDVPKLLSISFAGVLTSFAEGFSNSIIEYMAAGLPVVATNVGGAAEVIENDVNGFLVESDDDKDLAYRLNQLLTDQGKARSMGEKGKAIVSERFSLNAQLKKTTELYRRYL